MQYLSKWDNSSDFLIISTVISYIASKITFLWNELPFELSESKKYALILNF